jgi:hypothetical protein
MKRFWSVFPITVLMAGCGGGVSLHPVNGIVTLDGAPLDGAAVTFLPDVGTKTLGGMARTGAGGKFTLVGAKGEIGLAPGKYKVTVSKMKGTTATGEPPEGAVTEADMKDDLPAIYSNPGQTILAFQVTGDGKPIEIKLDSKKK